MNGENCPVGPLAQTMLLPRLRVVVPVEDLDPLEAAEDGQPYAACVYAGARHGLTNYDDLLGAYAEDGQPGMQGLCYWHVEHGGACTLGEGTGETWLDCPTLRQVYFALKDTATDLGINARRAISRE